jgi:hypothetical protein
MGIRKRKRASGRKRSGAFLLPALIVLALGVLVGMTRPWTLLPRRAPAPAAIPIAPAVSRSELISRLSAVLEREAQWREKGSGSPPEWRGALAGKESLVHWNARISTAIEGAGLQVTSGTEELLERENGNPVQRLTLEVGAAGERVARIVVETRRSPYLPPSF